MDSFNRGLTGHNNVHICVCVCYRILSLLLGSVIVFFEELYVCLHCILFSLLWSVNSSISLSKYYSISNFWTKCPKSFIRAFMCMCASNFIFIRKTKYVLWLSMCIFVWIIRQKNRIFFSQSYIRVCLIVLLFYLTIS